MNYVSRKSAAKTKAVLQLVTYIIKALRYLLRKVWNLLEKLLKLSVTEII